MHRADKRDNVRFSRKAVVTSISMATKLDGNVYVAGGGVDNTVFLYDVHEMRQVLTFILLYLYFYYTFYI